MDIRKKLTIRFCLIVMMLFMLFSVSVYFFSSIHRKSEFYTRLKNRGITVSQILENIKEMDTTLLKEINKNTKNALFGETIFIYDNQHKLIYSNVSSGNASILSQDLLQTLGTKREYRFFLQNMEALGFIYQGNKVKYDVIISADDQLGFSGLQSLKVILLIGFLLSSIFSYLLGWIFSGSALKPIAHIVNDVEKITATALNLRLDEGKRQDELERLAATFNRMLDRIQGAFESQKGFISNASHELRTPLTSMKGHIEVTLARERNSNEYAETLNALLLDIDNLSKISNNLLALALATTDAGTLKLTNVRLDELLFSAKEELLKNHPDYFINITFLSLPEAEKQLSIEGSEQLIKTAFLNLLENGCKYSNNNSVEVLFNGTSHEIRLDFINSGVGIPEMEIGQLFQPFYRGTNVQDKPGSGLGLALTQKIIELHKGGIEIRSVLAEKTTVKVVFPVSIAV
jgi:signal transduction histidine kinase